MGRTRSGVVEAPSLPPSVRSGRRGGAAMVRPMGFCSCISSPGAIGLRMPAGMPGRPGLAGRPPLAVPGPASSRRIGLPTSSKGVGPGRPVPLPARIGAAARLPGGLGLTGAGAPGRCGRGAPGGGPPAGPEGAFPWPGWGRPTSWGRPAGRDGGGVLGRPGAGAPVRWGAPARIGTWGVRFTGGVPGRGGGCFAGDAPSGRAGATGGVGAAGRGGGGVTAAGLTGGLAGGDVAGWGITT